MASSARPAASARRAERLFARPRSGSGNESTGGIALAASSSLPAFRSACTRSRDSSLGTRSAFTVCSPRAPPLVAMITTRRRRGRAWLRVGHRHHEECAAVDLLLLRGRRGDIAELHLELALGRRLNPEVQLARGRCELADGSLPHRRTPGHLDRDRQRRRRRRGRDVRSAPRAPAARRRRDERCEPDTRGVARDHSPPRFFTMIARRTTCAPCDVTCQRIVWRARSHHRHHQLCGALQLGREIADHAGQSNRALGSDNGIERKRDATPLSHQKGCALLRRPPPSSPDEA